MPKMTRNISSPGSMSSSLEIASIIAVIPLSINAAKINSDTISRIEVAIGTFPEKMNTKTRKMIMMTTALAIIFSPFYQRTIHNIIIA